MTSDWIKPPLAMSYWRRSLMAILIGIGLALPMAIFWAAIVLTLTMVQAANATGTHPPPPAPPAPAPAPDYTHRIKRCDPPRHLDAWNGFDKGEHLLVGTAVAAGLTFQTRDPWAGFWAGVGISVAKEAFDRYAGMGGSCSWRDLAAGALGAGLGAAGASLMLRYSTGGTPMLVYYRPLP